MSFSKLIEREILFGNPERVCVRLSPDGKYLTYIAPYQGVLNIWIAPLDNIKEAFAITQDEKRGIHTYNWAFDSKTLLYMKDQDGNENWQLFSVDAQTRQHKCLTPQSNIQARIEKLSASFPQELLVAINDRDPTYHDLYKLNIQTGEKVLIFKNEAYSGYICDENLELKLLTQETSGGGSAWFHFECGKITFFQEVPVEDRLTTAPLRFNKEGSKLYFIDSRGRDTGGLFEFNFATGTQALIGGDSRTDISDIMVSPVTKKIEAYAITYGRKEWIFCDEKIAEELKSFQTIKEGDIEVLSRTLNDQHWIVGFIKDNGPLHYYHYDRHQKQRTFLFSNRPNLENMPLVKMRPTIIKARDGLDLMCYLSLPKDSEKPSQPLPLVLFVHGGPSARDYWGYEPIPQWLANRGYAVLSVNYRGSTGFGKNFLNAGNGEWGQKMHEDLLDAIQWVIDRKIADPQKVAIMGGSYGGYATLVGLTFTPDIFACGIDIVGPSNLVTLVESIPPYWKPYLAALKVTIGADFDTIEGKEFLEKRSPIHYANQIKKPLLICHGANDPRVKQAESDQIVNKMAEKNIPVTYVLYPDEGHGLTRPENRLSFFGIAEAFLSQNLGGRKQPLGPSDFKSSSFQVKAGKEIIADLENYVAEQS
ncbi:peptidase S9 [Candidatus Paracaedimonas acanthamoebae]|nr:peptidase S9 [Candidatus Paracaedimonas acanthamoebae]